MERDARDERFDRFLEHLREAEGSVGATADGQPLYTVYPMVYQELRRLARSRLRSERDGHTLNTTALVNEAFLKLAQSEELRWAGREQFFALAAQTMRFILVDYARARKRQKRGDGQAPVSLDEARFLPEKRADELIALDEALTNLAARDARLSRVVEYRYFTGLSIEETAEVLGVSTMTVKRDWGKAKAYLSRELTASLG